jgi:hypothetical protein
VAANVVTEATGSAEVSGVSDAAAHPADAIGVNVSVADTVSAVFDVAADVVVIGDTTYVPICESACHTKTSATPVLA